MARARAGAAATGSAGGSVQASSRGREDCNASAQEVARRRLRYRGEGDVEESGASADREIVVKARGCARERRGGAIPGDAEAEIIRRIDASAAEGNAGNHRTRI